MAVLVVSVKRSATAKVKTGSVEIKVKQTGQVLESYTQNFPLDTGDGHILEVLIERAKDMMRGLAVKQIPDSFSFEVDSDQIRARRVFGL